MYSMLKTKKKSLVHHKYCSVTHSLFLTNNHILFVFADKSYMVFSLHLSASDSALILFEGQLSEQVIQAERTAQGKCVLITKNCSNLWLLSFNENSQHEEEVKNNCKVSIDALERGPFSNMLSNDPHPSLLKTMGCQIKLHTFSSTESFIVQFNIHEDHKIIFDCYRSTPSNPTGYTLTTLQIDLNLHDLYICEQCDKVNGEIVIYKQESIDESDWQVKILKPFLAGGGQKDSINTIILPLDRFHDRLTITQIVAWKIAHQYLIITSSLEDHAIQCHILNTLNQVNHIETLTTFPFFADNPNFISIIHTDPAEQVFYALTQTHQRIDGELYNNGLVIGHMSSGNSIERGYWSCKCFNFSPDARCILDVPTQYETYGQTLFHVRLLFSKSSLYMFLIDNCSLGELSEGFKEKIIHLL